MTVGTFAAPVSGDNYIIGASADPINRPSRAAPEGGIMADSPEVAHARRRLDQGPRPSEAYLRIVGSLAIVYAVMALVAGAA